MVRPNDDFPHGSRNKPSGTVGLTFIFSPPQVAASLNCSKHLKLSSNLDSLNVFPPFATRFWLIPRDCCVVSMITDRAEEMQIGFSVGTDQPLAR